MDDESKLRAHGACAFTYEMFRRALQCCIHSAYLVRSRQPPAVTVLLGDAFEK